MCTFRSPLVWSIWKLHPCTTTVPVPLAIGTPFWQNTYAPVAAFTNTTFPEFASSCRHKLNTFTGNEHVAVFPELSVAVHVTIVVPGGNIDPDGGLHTTVGAGGQLSVAVGIV
jgi:hypothetical protein